MLTLQATDGAREGEKQPAHVYDMFGARARNKKEKPASMHYCPRNYSSAPVHNACAHCRARKQLARGQQQNYSSARRMQRKPRAPPWRTS